MRVCVLGGWYGTGEGEGEVDIATIHAAAFLPSEQS